jgi:hypothetical protein
LTASVFDQLNSLPGTHSFDDNLAQGLLSAELAAARNVGPGRLLPQQFTHSFDNIGRRVHQILGHGFHFIPPRQIDLQPSLLRLRYQGRVVDRLI